VDLYDPETLSATTGSLFSVPVVRLPSQNELLPWLENVRKKFADLKIVGTDELGEKGIADFDFRQPVVLLVGNETSGLSVAYKSLCDTLVKIPMHGSASSLNVACASSIVLYEIGRQRGNC
jgi:TrmH family RNA methyltransferase